MERWDFDCQMCEDNIVNYAYVDEVWYVCPQETGWLDVKGDLEGVPYRTHKIEGSGWGRLGYTLCERCAIKAGLKCPICGAELIRVHADQHPGGHWGIREKPDEIVLYAQDYVIKRQPAEMR